MRFPLASPRYMVSRNLNNELPASQVEISPDFFAADMDILKELVTFSSEAITINESVCFCNIHFRTNLMNYKFHEMNTSLFVTDLSFTARSFSVSEYSFPY